MTECLSERKERESERERERERECNGYIKKMSYLTNSVKETFFKVRPNGFFLNAQMIKIHNHLC